MGMKKIIILADGWKRYVNYSWLYGCKKYIEEQHLEVQIDVFHCFGNMSKDEMHNLGEYNIFNLPDLTQYDGILLEITNIVMDDQAKRIIEKVKESQVPAVSLLIKIPGLYRAGIDNYGNMTKIVEHLIQVHDCKVINYVGGPVENCENNSRERAYRDALERHGIPIEPERIFQQNYEVETGMDAFRYFHDNHLMPDAFVCANENIAVGLCQKAMEHGYHIPEDFRITGFDDFDKASYFEPRITTVGYSKDDIAYEAMKLLHEIWQEKNVPEIVYAKANLIFQDSCGCVNEGHKRRSDSIKERIFSEVRQIDLYNETMDMNRNLFTCDTYEQMAEQLLGCVNRLRCKEMYLVMNHDILKSQTKDVMEDFKEEIIVEGYPDQMDVVLAYKDGERRYDIPKKPGELLPEIWNRNIQDVRVFLPLHMREREVGYFVFVNCDYMMENQFIFETINSFSKSLEYFYSKTVLRHANDKLSVLYLQDSLTGLYNRMAYNQLARPLFQKCMEEKKPIAIVFFDSDHLKLVNDQYGHDMGNVIITSVADAIKKHFPQNSVAMRYGGDEYVVLAPDCKEDQVNEMIARFHETLQIATEEKKLPFVMECSVGYVIAEDDSISMDEYINEADDKMYQEKKKRRALREKKIVQ